MLNVNFYLQFNLFLYFQGYIDNINGPSGIMVVVRTIKLRAYS